MGINMKVTHNIQSMNAIRLVNINIESFAESTRKISSGYKINCAANDPAGLGLSEVMRRQIRGLMQATNNTKDGVAFVQTADGAMDEIHSMLQRMNELTIHALNGTLTDSDRMAMNVEFDQLRTEMDRINNTTEFGTGIPVFEQHEPSYYQISGNIKWDDNQTHTVAELNNELNIHLPDGYEPQDYTITVPAGTYTTQELIDEIDTALSNMVPSDPGFVLELTSDGYCNLIFEKADGSPTEIASVDGSLSYLLFNSFNGSSSSSLIGTTVFGAEFPLPIKAGENNQLQFYVESATVSKWVSITIPVGDYYRSDMIEAINKELSKDSELAGIVAKEYEDSCIQITGGDSVSIVGLKGNMFKLDDSSADIKYSSVFYDNIQYGSSGGTVAYVRGRAYSYYYDTYPATVTDRIYLSEENQNNILRFTVNGVSATIEFTEREDGYTIKDICDEINNQLKTLGLQDEVEASWDTEYVSVFYPTSGSTSYLMQYLTLSSLLKGSRSSLEFDFDDENPVYENTYNALFRDTNYLPYQNGTLAYLTGRVSLNDALTLAQDAYLTFQIYEIGDNDGKPFTITGIGGEYEDGDALAKALTNKLVGTVYEDKIEFKCNADSGYIIYINALTDEIQRINFVDEQRDNKTYKQLFVETSTPSVSWNWYYGNVTTVEGDSGQRDADPATAYISIPANRQDAEIEITGDTNILTFRTNYGTGSLTVKLATGKKYSMQNIIDQINAQLNSSANSGFSSIEVIYNTNTNRFELTALSNKNTLGNYYIYFDYGSSAWPAILGTTEYHATYTQRSDFTLGVRSAIPEQITVDGSNNELILTIGNQDPVTIYIDQNTDYSREALAGAVQNAINKTDLAGKVTVSIDAGTGRFQLTASSGSITAKGSFYENVIITQKTEEEKYEQQGTYTPDTDFQSTYIIGRKDLSTETVDIVTDANDVFTFDFTYTNSKGVEDTKTISIQIPEGTYTDEELARVMQNIFETEDFLEDFDIKVGIGLHTTDVVGANDETALQIEVTRKDGVEPAAGQYVIDGVRGSAASFIFYKTTINPNATYITGTKNLSNGITFSSGQNVLTLSADSVPYQYTFPENTYYSAEEFVNLLNDMFENGDDNGNSAPLVASIENGSLKIAHKSLGSHSITDIGGSARSTLFLEEEGRDSLDPLVIQVGSEAKQTTEIPRISVSSTALGINSITISKQKYAEKANVRIKEAINLLSSKRSTYGAIQNRLEHTINNNDIIIDRVQASESRLRDTDLSSEMIRYSNLSILLQAGQEMLAQSNEKIKKLLNLLQ